MEAHSSKATTKIFTVQGTAFEVPSHYTVHKSIGYGAYGVVVAATNDTSKEKLAVKKVPKVFHDLTDGKRILREIKLLNHFKHENLISIRDIFRPANFRTFQDVYIVNELMDTDLHQVIKSKQRLTEEHCQYFIYQVLRGLKYIHSAKVIHRDLKPSNLLVNSNCDLRICDFGLARGVESSAPEGMTEYVVTRWYRAPELLLLSHHYTQAVDIWSVGCIAAEILNRKPLFPGKDHKRQLDLVVEVLGSPVGDDLAHITSPEGVAYIRSIPRKEPIPLEKLVPNASATAIDFLKKILIYNPSKRPSAEELLAHPFMAPLHDPSDEPASSVPFQFPFDDFEVTEPQLRYLLWQEITKFHPN